MSSHDIYTGTWTDWTKGRVFGSTLTLSSSNAGFLSAFLALFVTLVSAQIWYMITYAAHQLLAAEGEHDGMYYQRQHVLRNNQGPIATAYFLFQQAWTWRKTANRPLLRTTPWAIGAVLYFVIFSVLAVLSSRISEGATSNRLLRVKDCTISTELFTNDRSVLSSRAARTQQANTYVRQCYGDNSAEGCEELPSTRIDWTSEEVDCPFAEESICDGTALRMDSGLVDSHIHLGINEPRHNRVQYRREAICAPLSQEGYAELDENNSAVTYWDYGTGPLGNFTFRYVDGFGTRTFVYTTSWQSYVADAPEGVNRWTPDPDLMVEDRDITAMLIVHYGVEYAVPNDDPVFLANLPKAFQEFEGDERWMPNRPGGVLGCIEASQYCNPNNDECTPMRGGHGHMSVTKEDIGLNSVQTAIVQRMKLDSRISDYGILLSSQKASWVRAQETLGSDGLTSLQVAGLDGQWQREVKNLFQSSLAKLQWSSYLHSVPGGPQEDDSTRAKFWEDPEATTVYTEDSDVANAHDRLCHSQRTKMTGETINFSVLGLTIFCAIGSLILLVSYVIELAVAMFRAKTGWGNEVKEQMWESDDTLEVMRRYFELKGSGTWVNGGSVPRTVHRESFKVGKAGDHAPVLEVVDERTQGQATYTKVVDKTVEEGDRIEKLEA